MTRPLLHVEDLSISFSSPAGRVEVVKSVSFEINREIVALVGESGSGKSLTGRALMGLLPRRAVSAASILSLEGRDLNALSPSGWRKLRGNDIGLILQDPKFSLNPALQIGRQVEEVLLLHTKLTSAERRERALDMMNQVGLPDPVRLYKNYPGELSGGMGQRVMIAAMLVNRPKLLIADEPTSALDHDLQIQVLSLLRNLTEKLGMGLLLISHDLKQVARYSNRVLVMRHGTIVDRLAGSDLEQSPHPYTRALWNARPSAQTYGTMLPVFNETDLSA